jgi:hypothetical protein
MKHLETIAAIYETLGLRVLEMLAGEDSVTAEVVIGGCEELHLWTFGAEGRIVRLGAA